MNPSLSWKTPKISDAGLEHLTGSKSPYLELSWDTCSPIIAFPLHLISYIHLIYILSKYNSTSLYSMIDPSWLELIYPCNLAPNAPAILYNSKLVKDFITFHASNPLGILVSWLLQSLLHCSSGGFPLFNIHLLYFLCGKSFPCLSYISPNWSDFSILTLTPLLCLIPNPSTVPDTEQVHSPC